MVTPTPIFEIRELIGEILINLAQFEPQTVSCVNNLFHGMCKIHMLAHFAKDGNLILWNVLVNTSDPEKGVPLNGSNYGLMQTIIYKDDVKLYLSDNRVLIEIKYRIVGTNTIVQENIQL
jgi:hypothetical protein